MRKEAFSARRGRCMHNADAVTAQRSGYQGDSAGTASAGDLFRRQAPGAWSDLLPELGPGESGTPGFMDRWKGQIQRLARDKQADRR